ncbi:glycosyltransferase family A protein [Rhodohalobacter sp. SW132]|uniref:glycosyltransferase family 2 protein n=1 Tax=Rhodohalobacter sp. SW132 TaxID=2293433 RepID=UPI00131402C8|nr:glycosyltransferase family A protein [Rhodohalobacter sp. SW132]
MNSPLVSIVIPTYNRPGHLVRAIESALRQTYENIEIIVVDDCSDLDLDQFREEFPAVKLYKNSDNRGACFSRNRGLEIASGDYINFLDDDDELYPDKIALQIQKFQRSADPNLGMVTCHLEDYRSGNKQIVRNRVNGDVYRLLLSKFAIAGTESMLFKRSVFDEVGGFDENLQSSQEYDLFLRVSELFTVDYVDKILSRKNRSSDQISLNFDKKMAGAKYLFKKHDERYRQIGFLFWLKMRLKLRGLICRFYIGKWFGEKAYRLTIRD